MRRKQKIELLRLALGDEGITRGNEIIFFCPKHSHHKPKLSVNVVTDHFNCWICGFKGKNLKPLVFLSGKNALATKYVEECDDTPYVDQQAIVYDVPVLPESFKTLSGHDGSPYRQHAINFLKRRGIGKREILLYKLGYCESGEYRGRIIIPSFDNIGNLNFFVGRKFYEHIGLSYKHGNFDKDIIFNDYLVDWSKSITLVEGSFDSMMISNNSIPLQGTILSESSLLFAKIVASGVLVYLALDADAERKQMKIMELLTSYGVNVNMIMLSTYGINDPGEMTETQFNEVKKKAVNMNSRISKLRLRARP